MDEGFLPPLPEHSTPMPNKRSHKGSRVSWQPSLPIMGLHCSPSPASTPEALGTRIRLALSDPHSPLQPAQGQKRRRRNRSEFDDDYDDSDYLTEEEEALRREYGSSDSDSPRPAKVRAGTDY